MKSLKFKIITQNLKYLNKSFFATICLIFAFCTLNFALPLKADAHILKTDGSIGAVLHTDPDDDPIVGQQTNFFFEFKDKTGKFDVSNCECTVSITENSKQLASDPMQTDSSNNTYGSYSFTFPQKDVYQVIVNGKPDQAGAFQPFTLTYDIRVAREGDTNNTKQNFVVSHIPHAIGAVVILGFFIFLLLKQKRDDTKKP